LQPSLDFFALVLREYSQNASFALRVISRRRLREFWARHADAESALKAWYTVARRARWGSLVEIRRTYSSAEGVGRYTVFNIKGNGYRLIARIEYHLNIIFIKEVLTHAEYDKDKWK
jgi:mRNA interferase HigB